MTPCPVCQRSTTGADLILYPYVYGQTLALTLRINPDWKREDGMCRTCLDSIMDTVAEIEDMTERTKKVSLGSVAKARR